MNSTLARLARGLIASQNSFWRLEQVSAGDARDVLGANFGQPRVELIAANRHVF